MEGDNRVGPLSMLQLSERGIEPSTLVWTAGMADWARADCVPELAHLLAYRTPIDEQESAFGAYARPDQPAAGPYGPYEEPQKYGAYNNVGSNGNQVFVKPSTNWKTLAIIATVAGFLFSCVGGIVGGIVGVFAIAQANKAENAMRCGDDFTAKSAWSSCKTLCIVSFILSGIGLVYSGKILSRWLLTGLI